MVSVRLTVCVCGVGVPESVTLKVNDVALAVAVGVPLIAPVEAFSARPYVERALPLVCDHVYGVVPPVAASVVLYAVPTWPLGSEEVLMLTGAG